MENQTTAPQEQSEQQQPVATENTQATVEAQAEAPVVNFRDLISEEFKEEKSLQNFNSMDDFVKSYLSAQKLVGANKIAIPNKMATDEDWQQVFQKLGAPASPDEYKYDFKEEEINQDQLKAFNETAHKLGLLPQQAEKLINFYNEMNTSAKEQSTQVAANKQIEVEAQLKKEFGAQYGKRMDQAKRLAQETFGNDLLNNTFLQDGSRLGDNPEVIKAFSMLADKLSEDEIIKGDSVGYMTASQIEKEISELTEEGSPYWDKRHPNHRKAVEEVLKLRESLNG
jgi:hypothetical protein